MVPPFTGLPAPSDPRACIAYKTITTPAPAIGRFALNDDASLRAAALSALRWIDGTRAESLLARALAADTDSTVRMAAARALEEREASRVSR